VKLENLASMFSWNATRKESSVSGQPSSFIMLYNPNRLTVSKGLVRSMKTRYQIQGMRSLNAFFFLCCLS